MEEEPGQGGFTGHRQGLSSLWGMLSRGLWRCELHSTLANPGKACSLPDSAVVGYTCRIRWSSLSTVSRSFSPSTWSKVSQGHMRG